MLLEKAHRWQNHDCMFLLEKELKKMKDGYFPTSVSRVRTTEKCVFMMN